jgi:hypothetical protein
MLFKKKTQNYCSDLDNFLEKMREILPLSESQRLEIKKHARINTLRDTVQMQKKETLWKDF